MKEVTLSIPDDLLEKSRAYAQKHGTSLNEFIRELLRRYVVNETDSPLQRLLSNSDEIRISTKSWKLKDL